MKEIEIEYNINLLWFLVMISFWMIFLIFEKIYETGIITKILTVLIGIVTMIYGISLVYWSYKISKRR
jgi:hypothetical protein